MNHTATRDSPLPQKWSNSRRQRLCRREYNRKLVEVVRRYTGGGPRMKVTNGPRLWLSIRRLSDKER